MRRAGITLALVTLAAVASAVPAAADVRITDQAYVRHDGGTDPTIASCSSDAPAVPNGGERQQNEPRGPSTRWTRAS
jgi:hypothetical protein